LERFCYQIGPLLLPPEQSLRRFDVLVIVPQGPLVGLPLHAVWLAGRQEFLGHAMAVTYAPSITQLLRCMDRNTARFAPGGWEYRLDAPARVDRPRLTSCWATGYDGVGDQSQRFAEVAEEFASAFPGERYSGAGSRASLNNHLASGEYDVICLVCHGYHDPIYPDRSGVLLPSLAAHLAGEGFPHGAAAAARAWRPVQLHDGRSGFVRDLPLADVPGQVRPRDDAELFTVRELRLAPTVRAQLVALFACTTAMGQSLGGEEHLSLAHEWLKVGVPSVLANLWSLDLDFIRRWSRLFLDGLVDRQQPVAVAYQQAHRRLLAEEPDLHPYDWSVISLFGDWL
jgi:CHAT domain-containing protein